jgi:hypothetical protein
MTHPPSGDTEPGEDAAAGRPSANRTGKALGPGLAGRKALPSRAVAGAGWPLANGR